MKKSAVNFVSPHLKQIDFMAIDGRIAVSVASKKIRDMKIFYSFLSDLQFEPKSFDTRVY